MPRRKWLAFEHPKRSVLKYMSKGAQNDGYLQSGSVA
jgi:hypothetical protein